MLGILVVQYIDTDLEEKIMQIIPIGWENSKRKKVEICGNC